MTTRRFTAAYPAELRERGVRLFRETRADYSSDSAAYRAIAPKLGCSPESPRVWCQQAERDAGQRAGRLSNLRASRPARLPNPKPTTIKIKPAGSRHERGTSGGQVTPVLFDVQKSLDRVAEWTARAAAQRAKLVLFPEAMIAAYPKGAIFGSFLGGVLKRAANFIAATTTVPASCPDRSPSGWPRLRATTASRW